MCAPIYHSSLIELLYRIDSLLLRARFRSASYSRCTKCERARSVATAISRPKKKIVMAYPRRRCAPRARRFTFSFSPISIFEVCFHTWGTAPFCQLGNARFGDIKYTILKKICERDTDEAYARSRQLVAFVCAESFPEKYYKGKCIPMRSDVRIITLYCTL